MNVDTDILINGLLDLKLDIRDLKTQQLEILEKLNKLLEKH